MADDALVCPSCRIARPPDERFCETCGMPLVHSRSSEPAASERQRLARKIKPQYADGPLVEVAHAENLSQAEFIAGMLLEEGIPSYLRSVVNGRGQLGGESDILVPESGAEAAREALKWDGSGLGGTGS
jgi:hypothetical protein